MTNDVKTIRKSDKVYVSADKTSNMYKVSKDEYNKHNAELQQTAPGAIRLIIIMNKR